MSSTITIMALRVMLSMTVAIMRRHKMKQGSLLKVASAGSHGYELQTSTCLSGYPRKVGADQLVAQLLVPPAAYALTLAGLSGLGISAISRLFP